MWYPLEGRSSRSSIKGDIKLKLSLATREDRGLEEDDNWTDVRQHEDLISVFIQHEISKSHVSFLKKSTAMFIYAILNLIL
jgi:BAI1-associated protein 3